MAGQGPHKAKIEEFLLAICICHQGRRVQRSATQDSEQHHFKSIQIEDEAQLDFAYQLVYAFKSRENNIIVIKKQDQDKGYNLRY